MLLDLETSFEEIKSLPIANFIALPINAQIEKFKDKISNLKFPLWIKLNSSEHKLKLGGVKKAANFEELKKIHSQFKKEFPKQKFIVQENKDGIEIILGIKQDKTFGKVLLIGAGGSLAELIQDTEFRVLPLEKQEIEACLQNLKVYKILEEKKANLSKLIDLIEKISNLEIEEADFNPIIVNSKEAVIVDARIQIEQK